MPAWCVSLVRVGHGAGRRRPGTGFMRARDPDNASAIVGSAGRAGRAIHGTDAVRSVRHRVRCKNDSKMLTSECDLARKCTDTGPRRSISRVGDSGRAMAHRARRGHGARRRSRGLGAGARNHDEHGTAGGPLPLARWRSPGEVHLRLSRRVTLALDRYRRSRRDHHAARGPGHAPRPARRLSRAGRRSRVIVAHPDSSTKLCGSPARPRWRTR